MSNSSGCLFPFKSGKHVIKGKGISVRPWDFSPDTRLLLDELKFLRNYGINVLRFNSLDDGWWFPLSAKLHGEKADILDSNREHVKDIMDVWVSFLGGTAVISLFGWERDLLLQTLTLLRLQNQEANSLSIYGVSIDDVETYKFLSIITRGTLAEAIKIEGNERLVKELLTFYDLLIEIAEEKTQLLSAIPKNPLSSSQIVFDIWNGAEAWQEDVHSWTWTKIRERFSFLFREGTDPEIIEKSLVDFEKQMAQLVTDSGFQPPSYIGNYREHVYFYRQFPGHLRPIYHKYELPADSSQLAFTEVGVSRKIESYVSKRIGSYNPDVVLPQPDLEGWEKTVNYVLEKKPALVCLHSLLDGRFKELTYDKGSCRDLFNIKGYEYLADIKGYPHYDGILHSIQKYREIIPYLNKLGFNFTPEELT